MRTASAQQGPQESERMINSLYHRSETDSTDHTEEIPTEIAGNVIDNLQFSQRSIPSDTSFDQLTVPRNNDDQYFNGVNFMNNSYEFIPCAQNQQRISDSSRPPSLTINHTSSSFSQQPSIDDFIQSSDEQKNKTQTQADQKSRFLAPIHLLVQMLFYYFLPQLYEKCTLGDRAYERVILQSKCVLEQVTIILPRLPSERYNIVEIIAASLYIALETTEIGVNNMIKSFYGRELSLLRSFQLFVNAIEVLYKASRHEYHSANPGVKIRSPSFCIDNVVKFLQLCEQIARELLITSNLENLDSYKMCLYNILGIEIHYSDICTAATSMYFLNHINIFGRKQYPELLVKVQEEVKEQKTQSEQQKTNEKGQKRRRTDENEDEQDNIPHPLELSKILKEDDEQLLSQQEDDEQLLSQQEDDELPKTYKTKKERQNITDRFRERIVQIVNDKLNKLNDSQFLVNTNLLLELNNIPQIDASPLSQPFSQECVQLPFYNVCRQDELQEVVQKIFQLSDSGETKKKR
ncbi:MAG: hypothetical protein EZS28_019249 [Streblomastix strix]|uniref:Uncharacterized protein n=1 Tax=Streblomastix strix TaxID=222440 RepID=A0A5J4VRP8_9EUKA|nr:MAG: hypothetical protein EZS28_019249 [Streblomastix strix]